MALYIPQSILHLAQSLYVRPETYGPTYVLSKSFYSLEDFLNDQYSHRRSGWPSQKKDIMNIICYTTFCILDMVPSPFQYAFLILFPCFMSGLFIDC